MAEIQLTKDADALICVLYKEYLEKRKSGVPKRSAGFFGSSKTIHANLMQKWPFEDVDDTIRELSRADLLNCLFADNIAYEVSISEIGVIYMENRFKDGLASLFSYIEKIRLLIPL